jgi:hypothetical protein
MQKTQYKKRFSLRRRHQQEKDEQPSILRPAYDLRPILEASESEEQGLESLCRPKAVDEIKGIVKDEPPLLNSDEADEQPLLESRKDDKMNDDEVSDNKDETAETIDSVLEKTFAICPANEKMPDEYRALRDKFESVFAEAMTFEIKAPENDNSLEMFEASFENLLIHDTSVNPSGAFDASGESFEIPFAASPPASSKAPTPFYKKKDTNIDFMEASMFAAYPPRSSKAPTAHGSRPTDPMTYQVLYAMEYIRRNAKEASQEPEEIDYMQDGSSDAEDVTNDVTDGAKIDDGNPSDSADVETTGDKIDASENAGTASVPAEEEAVSYPKKVFEKWKDMLLLPLIVSAFLYIITDSESEAIIGGFSLALCVNCAKVGKFIFAKCS